jgi:hypothetical protein
MSCDVPQPEFGVLPGTFPFMSGLLWACFTAVMILCFSFSGIFYGGCMVKWLNV